MKSKAIILIRLRNAAHFQFHTEFKGLVEELTPEALKIEALFQEYLPLYAKLDAAYKKIVKSVLTEQIQEADGARDETWRGLMEAISSVLKHFDPQVRAAAKQLNVVSKTYGNVPKMSLNEETSAITNFVQDLEGPYAAHVAKVGFMPWVIELKARNIAFANLVRDRTRETSLKNLAVLKKARAKIDDVYYAIMRRISAFVEIEGSANYELFFSDLNVYIGKYLLLIAQSSKKGKKGKGETEDTQTQGGSL